jgi:hypothetical protein
MIETPHEHICTYCGRKRACVLSELYCHPIDGIVPDLCEDDSEVRDRTRYIIHGVGK